MNSLILSAGLGTRFRPHTDKTAKAAIPFLDVPMLGFPLAYCEDAEPERIVLNLHHLPHTVRAAVTKLTRGQKYDVKYSIEKPNILDSGGGIGKARKLVEGEGQFNVMNADSIFLLNHTDGLVPMFESHMDKDPLATVMVCEAEGCGEIFSGVWVDENNTIKDFGVHPGRKDLKPLHYIGSMILSDRIFEYIPDGGSKIFFDVMLKAIAKGEKISVHKENDCKWFETGNFSDYTKAQNECLEILKGPESPYKKNLTKILKRHLGKFDFEKNPPKPLE